MTEVGQKLDTVLIKEETAVHSVVGTGSRPDILGKEKPTGMALMTRLVDDQLASRFALMCPSMSSLMTPLERVTNTVASGVAPSSQEYEQSGIQDSARHPEF